jgi:hypothetical protein
MNRSLRRLVCSAAVVGAACAAAQADDIMTIDSVQVGISAYARTQYSAVPPVGMTVNSFPTTPISVQCVTASKWWDNEGGWTAYARGEAWITARDYPGMNSFGAEMHQVSSRYASTHHWADSGGSCSITVDFTLSQPTRARMQLDVCDPSHGGGSPNFNIYDKGLGLWILGGYSSPSTTEFDLPAGSYSFQYSDTDATWLNYEPEGFYGTSVFHFEVPTPGALALLGGGLLMMSIRRR